MIDHSQMKLGRKAVKTDSRTLRLARYLTVAELPSAPVQVDWSHGIANWGMMLNDRLGDCTIAACAHAVQAWSASSVGLELTAPDDVVLQAYEQWCGYDPANPSTDGGGVELDVLTAWRKNGLAGHALTAFAAASPFDPLGVQTVIYLFGGVYIGIQLPVSAQTQEVWDYEPGPNGDAGSWGGHAVFVVGYDATGLTCVTWGQLKRMTWNFWHAYVDECYALLGAQWISQHGAPNGFALDRLQADLAAIQ